VTLYTTNIIIYELYALGSDNVAQDFLASLLNFIFVTYLNFGLMSRLNLITMLCTKGSTFTMALPACLFAYTLLSSAKAQTDNGDECSCFVTNDSTAAYFTYHRFWDFRNVDNALDIEPNVLIDPMNTSNAPPTSSYFTNYSWAKDWALQSWNNSDSVNGNNVTVLMINSPNNVFIRESLFNFNRLSLIPLP
jgi:hypothetical protein